MDATDKVILIIGICGLILAIIGVYAISNVMSRNTFIKELKLEKKFQEWKKDNKGLL